MRALLALLLILVPTAAFAHTGHGDTAGLLHGFMHPIGGLDHVLAMVAVGVFAFVLGGRALWLVPLSFVAMMVVGFGLGVARRRPALRRARHRALLDRHRRRRRARPPDAGGRRDGAGRRLRRLPRPRPRRRNARRRARPRVCRSASSPRPPLLHLAGIGAAIGVARLVGRYGKTAAQVAGGLFALGGVGVLAGWL